MTTMTTMLLVSVLDGGDDVGECDGDDDDGDTASMMTADDGGGDDDDDGDGIL